MHFCFAHRRKSREVIEKGRFCQNTRYTDEDWVGIGMSSRDSGGEWKWVVKVEVEGGRRQREVVAVVVVTFVEYARWRWEENGGRDGSRYISMAMRYGFS